MYIIHITSNSTKGNDAVLFQVTLNNSGVLKAADNCQKVLQEIIEVQVIANYSILLVMIKNACMHQHFDENNARS